MLRFLRKRDRGPWSIYLKYWTNISWLCQAGFYFYGEITRHTSWYMYVDSSKSAPCTVFVTVLYVHVFFPSCAFKFSCLTYFFLHINIMLHIPLILTLHNYNAVQKKFYFFLLSTFNGLQINRFAHSFIISFICDLYFLYVNVGILYRAN